MKIVKSKTFKNGTVYCLRLADGMLVETTDTFLPYYTKDAIGRKQNFLDNDNLGSRSERWMIGVSTMSGCPVRCKFCLVPGTKVLMSDFSLKNIEDIKLGDNVISNILTKASNDSISYCSKYYKTSNVSHLFKRKYIGDIVEITTLSGKKIKLTPNHKIAKRCDDSYRDKYIESSEIKEGDIIYTHKSNDISDLHENNEWITGWLYGFIKGDGVYTKNTNRDSYKTSVSQSNDLIFYAHKIINLMFGKTTKITEYKSNKHKTSYRFSFGEHTHDSIIREVELIKNTVNFKKGFVSGFWDAEGFSFRNNRCVRVCNNDIGLLEMFNSYIVELGYNSGTIKNFAPKDKGNRVLDTSISRIEFNTVFQPLNDKKNFLINDTKVKKICENDVVKTVEVKHYDGFVYNIETSEHTYIADGVLVHNCATGNMKKYRNLTADEIVEQVLFAIKKAGFNPKSSKEFKINYTRMGEPFLNIESVKEAIERITEMYPNTHHYVSTIGIKGSDFSFVKGNVTLQISLHSFDEEKRDWLIPYPKKMSIEELGQIRTESNLKTTINLTLVDESDFDGEKLQRNFDKEHFFVKLSPINPNNISEKNNLGNGIVEGVNLV